MVLNEVSDGLLAQLAFMKRNIQSQGAAPQCMKLEEWSKIRSKLGSAFPSVPDVSKVPSFESFRSKADSTLDALGSYYSTFIDIDDFRVTAMNTLKNIARARLTISLGLCPTLARNFLRLVVNYIKITCYVSSIEEAKVVLGMYGLAHMLKNHSNGTSSGPGFRSLSSASMSPLSQYSPTCTRRYAGPDWRPS